MTTITYRTPAAADTEALAQLGRDTFVDTFGHLYTDADCNAFLDKVFGPTGLPLEMLDPAIHFQIAVSDDQLIAFAKVGPVGVPVDTAGRRAVELKQLYVRKPWHGAGVAPTLMAWALEQARSLDAEDVYLSVYSDNERAQRFYTRYGFTMVGAYVFMVGNHADDERIMRLTLRPA